MHYRLLMALLLLLPTLGLANKEARPQPSYFQGAPKDASGTFSNYAGELSHGSVSIRVPFMLRRFGTYFRSGADAPQPLANAVSLLRQHSQDGLPSITWVGHATTLVQSDGITFLTDPIWSKRPSPVPLFGPSRYVEPGIALEDLPAIDFVVISHNHYDHLDLPTLKALVEINPQMKLFVPLGNGAVLRKNGINQVIEMDWGQQATFKNVTLHCLPSQHWSKRSLTDANKALWASWAITGPQRRIYYAGDTGYFPGFIEIGEYLGPFDLAIVPIGAYAPRAMMVASHMNPEEAYKAAVDLGASKALGVHYGTFDLSDEPLAEPAQRFLQASANDPEPGPDPWLPKIGETRSF